MNVVVVGANHKSCPIELREKISFSKKGLALALLSLKESPLLEGAVILSTCNRVELYAGAQVSGVGIKGLRSFLSRFHEIREEELLPCLYIYEGAQAIRHLFSVACGLDSLILGETQILGQVRSAILSAKTMGLASGYLEEAFDAACTFAEAIHRNGGVSGDNISIGSIAIGFIKDRLGDLSSKTIVIIGAGKVTELVLRHLQYERPKVVFVSNRTFEKSKELASRIGQSAERLDRLPQLLKQSDVVISATASPHFIIKKETLEGISRKLLILDLAIPRDVDPEVRRLKNVELFNLEDLSRPALKDLKDEAFAVERIERAINQESDLLWKRLTALEPETALLP